MKQRLCISSWKHCYILLRSCAHDLHHRILLIIDADVGLDYTLATIQDPNHFRLSQFIVFSLLILNFLAFCGDRLSGRT
jgi:hypothetical protein